MLVVASRCSSLGDFGSLVSPDNPIRSLCRKSRVLLIAVPKVFRIFINVPRRPRALFGRSSHPRRHSVIRHMRGYFTRVPRKGRGHSLSALMQKRLAKRRSTLRQIFRRSRLAFLQSPVESSWYGEYFLISSSPSFGTPLSLELVQSWFLQNSSGADLHFR